MPPDQPAFPTSADSAQESPVATSPRLPQGPPSSAIARSPNCSQSPHTAPPEQSPSPHETPHPHPDHAPIATPPQRATSPAQPYLQSARIPSNTTSCPQASPPRTPHPPRHCAAV